MLELNTEKIIKALECCFVNHSCVGCPMECHDLECLRTTGKQALAIINELLEDNKAKNETITSLLDTIKDIQADTVRKMQERLKVRCENIPQNHFTCAEVEFWIDQIAKEILEGNDDGQAD